jgi:polysaccharide export outer membrane protein
MRQAVILTMVSLCFFSSISILKAENTEPAAESTKYEYTVGVADLLEIAILQPEKMVIAVTVSPDGSITYPYIGQVAVKGLSLNQIQQEIQTRLAAGYMKYPVVSVSLKESRSRKFLVYGEVVRPGEYFIDESTTVLKAISMSGGFTKFGSSSHVKVLRPRQDKPGYEPIKVNIKAAMNGDPEADILLKTGDMVVVSEGVF